MAGESFREDFFERIGRTPPEKRPADARRLTPFERGAIAGARAALEYVAEDATEQDEALAKIAKREPERDRACVCVGYLFARVEELTETGRFARASHTEGAP